MKVTFSVEFDLEDEDWVIKQPSAGVVDNLAFILATMLRDHLAPKVESLEITSDDGEKYE